MRKAKPRISNIYESFIKQQGLKIQAFFCFILLFCLNCATKPQKTTVYSQKNSEISESAVNINTADAAELEKLPRVGMETARKIIEHREKYGTFRRPEELILVDGMSDKKFREIRNLVKTE